MIFGKTEKGIVTYEILSFLMRPSEKINLNFYFHTSLWCLKKFYEGLKGLLKTFGDTTKKCENKNLSKSLF